MGQKLMMMMLHCGARSQSMMKPREMLMMSRSDGAEFHKGTVSLLGTSVRLKGTRKDGVSSKQHVRV